MSNIHELTKTAKANVERLANDSGAIISYLDAPECEAVVVERYDGGAGTVTAQTTVTIGSVTGFVTSQVAKFMYGKKEAGGTGPVVEMTTTLAVDGASF